MVSVDVVVGVNVVVGVFVAVNVVDFVDVNVADVVVVFGGAVVGCDVDDVVGVLFLLFI